MWATLSHGHGSARDCAAKSRLFSPRRSAPPGLGGEEQAHAGSRTAHFALRHENDGGSGRGRQPAGSPAGWRLQMTGAHHRGRLLRSRRRHRAESRRVFATLFRLLGDSDGPPMRRFRWFCAALKHWPPRWGAGESARMASCRPAGSRPSSHPSPREARPAGPTSPRSSRGRSIIPMRRRCRCEAESGSWTDLPRPSFSRGAGWHRAPTPRRPTSCARPVNARDGSHAQAA